MDFNLFISNLTERLKKPLPGFDAQMKMSSNVRLRELMNMTHDTEPVASSVLMLLYPADGKVLTVFMLRPDYKGIHSGQISFPGGKFEKEDIDLSRTAIREAYEEIGIDPLKVGIAGKLTDLYIPPSNYLVTPFVGFTAARPVFRKDPWEVKEIIEVDLEYLFDPGTFEVRHFKVRDEIEIEAPSFVPGGHVIWGATAMIVSEFREIYQELTA